MENTSKKTPVRELVLTALFAALTAVGAFIRIPIGESSFTLQLLFVFLAGILLGPKWGAISQIVYVALGLVGLPIFTSGGGIGSVASPTFGFLLGFILSAWVVGMIAGKSTNIVRIIIACIVGDLAAYLIGLPYMAFVLNVLMGKGLGVKAVFMAGMIPFLPFDALKIVVTAIVSKPLVPQLKRLEAGRK